MDRIFLLRVDDGDPGNDWRQWSLERQVEIIFHEISHIYGTEDDDSNGIFMNTIFSRRINSDPVPLSDFLSGTSTFLSNMLPFSAYEKYWIFYIDKYIERLGCEDED